ncbi:MAG: DUF6883 domain-containing protein [Terriglobales bacterium]
MRLPNAGFARIDERKIVDYLLNPSHPDNGGKARFFEVLGFSVLNPEDLRASLSNLAGSGEVVEQEASVHGQKYVVEGAISFRSGRSSIVRSVWIIETGKQAPRLVTAYPAEK